MLPSLMLIETLRRENVSLVDQWKEEVTHQWMISGIFINSTLEEQPQEWQWTLE